MKSNIRSFAIGLLALAAVPATASFSDAQLRIGVTESDLGSWAIKSGYELKRTGDDKWWAYRKSDNEIIGTFRFCRGKVFEQALTVQGGASAFIKRVAQFNRQYGTGQYSVESSVESVGDRNMIEVVWRRADQVTTLTFFAGSSPVSETQWLGTTIPSICRS